MSGSVEMCQSLRILDAMQSHLTMTDKFDDAMEMLKARHFFADTIDTLRAQLEAAEARSEAAEAECARLREALDHVARVALGSRTASKRIVWIVDRCKSALNGDDAWRATSVAKGYHDALERAARTKEQQA